MEAAIQDGNERTISHKETRQRKFVYVRKPQASLRPVYRALLDVLSTLRACFHLLKVIRVEEWG